jgi:hypothetical protein
MVDKDLILTKAGLTAKYINRALEKSNIEQSEFTKSYSMLHRYSGPYYQ